MIPKCLAVLAVVAQINASGCGFSPLLLQSAGSPVVLVSGNSDSFGDYSSGVSTRNIIAKGKYPVAMRNCGPVPDSRIPVTTSLIQAPIQEKPTIRLPATVPAPRTVAHSCTCYKTIMRPRVHQQIITVPTIQRYVETSHKPVVENIQYEAVPVSCGSVELTSGCGPQIEVPRVQVVEAPQVQLPQLISLGSCQC